MKSHAFIEEEADELVNSNLINTENMTVEVFETFSLFLIVSLFSSDITSFIVVPKLFLRVYWTGSAGELNRLGTYNIKILKYNPDYLFMYVL